ncbi:hypothetical protein [Curtobacterium sp. PhB136]|uniref:hypothetical protein n=1 Tax=Curtobacterium sp. PhB136 TaxID=2485181 RepID=UPI001048FEE4|nr:hypothetical protein [Curtobacterium sp. PhB136]TCK61177.1 hypothetical protein EDF27_2887 [Curtobacterium sp. PhB136]
MIDVQSRTDTQSIAVQVEYAEDTGVPLTEVVRDLEDVLEVLDFALFLSHGDATRWANQGGRGQVRLTRLVADGPVSMELELVMSGGLGLTHAAVLAGLTATETVLRTAATIPEDAATDAAAEKRIREAFERVAYSARGTDLAWRVREAEEQITTSAEGTTGKGRRMARAAGRLTRKDAMEFRVRI